LIPPRGTFSHDCFNFLISRYRVLSLIQKYAHFILFKLSYLLKLTISYNYLSLIGVSCNVGGFGLPITFWSLLVSPCQCVLCFISIFQRFQLCIQDHSLLIKPVYNSFNVLFLHSPLVLSPLFFFPTPLLRSLHNTKMVGSSQVISLALLRTLSYVAAKSMYIRISRKLASTVMFPIMMCALSSRI
jgi:hypothetical protein